MIRKQLTKIDESVFYVWKDSKNMQVVRFVGRIDWWSDTVNNDDEKDCLFFGPGGQERDAIEDAFDTY